MSIAIRKELEREVSRVEALVGELETLPDDAARQTAVQAIEALLKLHGDGLDRILLLIADSPASGADLVRELADDELVSCLMMLHGLHPVSLEERVLKGLAKARPYLESHGGNVELVSIDEGVVKLRLEGSCKGCASSAATLKYAVEDAIAEAAPDVVRVETDGTDPEVPNFVSLADLSDGPMHGGWRPLPGVEGLASGQVRAVADGSTEMLVCRLDGNWYAYVDRCPECHGGLGNASLKAEVLTCPGCGHRFDARRAGRSLDSGVHLEPLPLLVDKGVVRVSLPVSAG